MTTAASIYVAMSGGLLGDIKDGKSVVVHGRRSDGDHQAEVVAVGTPFVPAQSSGGFVSVRGAERPYLRPLSEAVR